MVDANEYFYTGKNGKKQDSDLHAEMLENVDPIFAARELRASSKQLLSEGILLAAVKGFCGLPLPDGWHEFVISLPSVCAKPGIYEWRIEGVGVYIGRYKHISRPKREYALNVARLLAGLPYRRSNPEGFRRIHYTLAGAAILRKSLKLTILENVEPANLNIRERELIAERGTLNGPESSSLQTR